MALSQSHGQQTHHHWQQQQPPSSLRIPAAVTDPMRQLKDTLHTQLVLDASMRKDPSDRLTTTPDRRPPPPQELLEKLRDRLLQGPTTSTEVSVADLNRELVHSSSTLGLPQEDAVVVVDTEHEIPQTEEQKLAYERLRGQTFWVLGHELLPLILANSGIDVVTIWGHAVNSPGQRIVDITALTKKDIIDALKSSLTTRGRAFDFLELTPREVADNLHKILTAPKRMLADHMLPGIDPIRDFCRRGVELAFLETATDTTLPRSRAMALHSNASVLGLRFTSAALRAAVHQNRPDLVDSILATTRTRIGAEDLIAAFLHAARSGNIPMTVHVADLLCRDTRANPRPKCRMLLNEAGMLAYENVRLPAGLWDALRDFCQRDATQVDFDMIGSGGNDWQINGRWLVSQPRSMPDYLQPPN